MYGRPDACQARNRERDAQGLVGIGDVRREHIRAKPISAGGAIARLAILVVNRMTATVTPRISGRVRFCRSARPGPT